ncbi:MAG: hypothetical protein IPK52_25970 [Chloroflexi bacterium]|nr:hypothetical protein [Chloroflexota bacterium]
MEEATPRPTLIPSATQILFPERPETLSDIQALLQAPDEACQLPCFWGVRLGYTTEEEIIEFLQPVAVGSNAPELHYTFREEAGEEAILYLSFGVRDGIVTETDVVIHAPSEWLPDETLELSHLVSIIPSTPSAYLSINITVQRLFLTVAYDEGVLAQYSFVLGIVGETLAEADFRFCPVLEENYYIILRLRDGDAKFLLEGYGTLSDTVSDKIWTVERMTGMKVEDFVAQITENPDECIDLPSYSELLEMGYEF